MDDIKIKLIKKKWSSIQKYIQKNNIIWDIMIDQTNCTLHYLAYHWKNDLIKLIKHDILINIIMKPNIEGDTICHIAAKLNNIELFDYVIDLYPKIIYQQNKLLFAPLYYYVIDHKLIKKIVSKMKIVDHFINNEYTIVDFYILTKNIKMIKFLLEKIKKNHLTENAIFTIIYSSNASDLKVELLKIFIKNKINVNKLNDKFLSPLILSIYLKELKVIDFLLSEKADICYYGPENKHHPLTISILQSDLPTIKLLLQYNIKLNIHDKYLKTPLHYLFSVKNKLPIEIKQLLVTKIDNINLVDDSMNSILNLLIHNDNWKLYKDILVKKKLKIFIENKEGIMPINGIISSDMNNFIELVYKSYIYQLDPNMIWKDVIDNEISILKNSKNINLYKNYIINKIISGQSYPSKKKNKIIIKLIQPPKSNFTHFSAYTYNYICFLYYILEKYQNIKIPILAKNQMKQKKLKNLYNEMVKDFKEKNPENIIFKSIIRDYINHSPILINHVIIWKSNTKYFFFTIHCEKYISYNKKISESGIYTSEINDNHQ